MHRELLSAKIARLVDSIEFSRIPETVVNEVKKRIVDSLAVMAGAFNSRFSLTVLNIAELATSTSYGASIFGLKHKAPVDYAAFVNGCLVRYLDFNDTYLSKEALHPSDNIPALIAVAEAEGADGRRLIEGIVAAYEIACRLADASSIRARGWDHVTYIAISSSAGASKIMGLDEEKTDNAIRLATVANIALRQTRVGELSAWKGCAAANAARNGVFAALLAKHGIDGPSPIFEGEKGFWKLVSGRFDPGVFEPGSDQYKVLETSIKKWPVEYHAMSAVEASLNLVKRLGRLSPERIHSVEVRTFGVCYEIIARDPEKWDPKTRETADHSLTYLVSAALIDGDVWLETFSEERVRANDVRRLMSRMSIVVDEKYDREYPDAVPNTVTIKLDSGERHSETVFYPRGHYRNPMGRGELEDKFMRLASNLFDEETARSLLSTVWNLEKVNDLELLTSTWGAKAR
jgi:2-methylcitrate dehydratase